ncbi:hypothetical protein HY086_02770 [Candidatus Gottesmanbacteria bacterium]|nr:hypothetical protein [Candidatus Gottesmanbacteria bacterium]
MKKHFIFFFLDDFHHGAVNHLLHFIGFTVLGYGLGVRSIILIILSPIIMELGHFYNYARGIHREYAIKIIPLQWFAWILFVGLGFIISKLLQ